MSYVDGDVTRADQVDQGAGTHTVRAKQRNGKTYQETMPNDVDGTWSDSGGPLVKSVVATVQPGAAYRVDASMAADATNSQVWILVYDLDRSPTGGDSPVSAFPVFRGGKSTIRWEGGRPMTNGLAMAASTSLSSLADPGESKIRFEFNADTLGVA